MESILGSPYLGELPNEDATGGRLAAHSHVVAAPDPMWHGPRLKHLGIRRWNAAIASVAAVA